jgi:hypothetical protein
VAAKSPFVEDEMLMLQFKGCKMQSTMVFQIGGNPPVDLPNAPLYDTVSGEKNELHVILMNKGLESTGKINALNLPCTNANLWLK